VSIAYRTTIQEEAMHTATITDIGVRREPNTAFRTFLRKFGAKLRYLIELSAAPYEVMGSRYL